MSSFDDEFGLFGAEAGEEERRPTLGARKIAHRETIIDEIEPEEEPAPRRTRGAGRGRGEAAPRVSRPGQRDRGPHPGGEAGPELEARSKDLLEFLARGLVTHKDEIEIIPVRRPDGRLVLELEVDPEDLGKVIGKGGRVAQALRTLVRAGTEGKVAIDIIDVEAVEDEAEDGDEAEKTDEAPEAGEES